MRYIVTGDFHIKENRIKEVSDILNQIALKADLCDGVIILGDIFDHPTPTTLEIDCLLDFINAIKDKQVIILGGNHDLSNQIFASKWIKKLPYNIKVYESLNTTLNINNKKIYLGHHGVSESVLGPDDYHLSKSTTFKSINADVVLLGHIHKSQIISNSPLVVHPGSPYYINFGERNDKKGIGLLTIEQNTLTYSFIPLKIYSMIQLNINENEIDALEDKLDSISKNTKVKVVINITKVNSDVAIKLKKIDRKYKKKFIIFKLEKNSNIQITQSSNKEVSNIKKLLDQFCNTNKVPLKIKEKLEKIVL